MKTIPINVYEFSELSEEAKEKALNGLSDINVDYDWYDTVYADAENIGLKITGFDLYRSSISGDLLSSVGEICQKIINEHGKTCSTYQLAIDYYRSKKSNIGRLDQGDFKQALLQCYWIMLRNDYEYLTSMEAIIETIEANDYTFLDTGEMVNW
jgi:hypothetical protein